MIMFNGTPIEECKTKSFRNVIISQTSINLHLYTMTTKIGEGLKVIE